MEISRSEQLDYYRQQGWPTWDSFEFDHLRPDERSILEAAIAAGKSFVDEAQNGRGGGMILLSAAVDRDPERTGYGCGKTLLARTIYFIGGSNIKGPVGGPDFKILQDEARFLTSRELMSVFDGDEFEELKKRRRLFVIDDVGREGALRWERRDSDSQLSEKQARYYALIDFCYQAGRALVLTTNYSAAQLAAFLGGASWSRLTHMVRPEFRVNLTGIRDFRPILARRPTVGDGK